MVEKLLQISKERRYCDKTSKKNSLILVVQTPIKNITIKNLLSHRSGLPNYVHFMEGGSTVDIIRKKNKKGKMNLDKIYWNKMI